MVRITRGIVAIITVAMVTTVLASAEGAAAESPKQPPSVQEIVTAALPASPQSGSRGTILSTGKLNVNGIVVKADDVANSVIRRSGTGGQVLTVLRHGTDSAMFHIDLPSGASLKPSGDGGYTISGDQGIYGSIEAPWAVDANGKQLATHYLLHGATISQKVDTEGAVFPIVADPSFRWCDWYTAVCMKLNRSETSWISDTLFVGVGAAVGSLCGIIPWSPWQLGAVKAACAGIVAAYFFALRGTFATARAQGRCVELHFGVIGPPVLRWWGVVNC